MDVITKCAIASVEYSGTFVTRMPLSLAFWRFMLLNPVPASQINSTESGSNSTSTSISFVTMQLWPLARSATTSGVGEASECAVSAFLLLLSLLLSMVSVVPNIPSRKSALEMDRKFSFPSKSNRPALTTHTRATRLVFEEDIFCFQCYHHYYYYYSQHQHQQHTPNTNTHQHTMNDESRVE